MMLDLTPTGKLFQIGESDNFDANDEVNILVNLADVTDSYKLKVMMNRDGEYDWEYTAENWEDIDTTWGPIAHKFWPVLAGPDCAGNYEAEVFKDLQNDSSGFEHLGSVNFSRTGADWCGISSGHDPNDPGYTLDYIKTGIDVSDFDSSSNSMHIIGENSTFPKGQDVWLLTFLDGPVYVDHTFKSKVYRNGLHMWDDQSGLIDVDNVWGWGSSYWPSQIYRARPGDWKVDISLEYDGK